MSSISIIGLGGMARALAARALAAGNAVEIIGRDEAEAAEVARALGDGATTGRLGAVPAAEIVILAVPYSSAASLVEQYGNALSGKVIVDIANPFAADFTGLATSEGSSAAQEIAAVASADARVVKAFNTIFATVLADDAAQGRSLDVFIAGDDAQAKAKVSAFIESLGLRPLDTGPLRMARSLEETGLLMMGLARHGVGFDFSLRVATSAR
ncbi:NAD(P)-binding domain-containing protein [Nocardia sp. CA2R105]|uniref:NADPH-dependent F420 reductase n=1 Tax=Nocardia coffeae TaxID=2873381 RepID=UPI001CA766A4|nr:NAD(P)-binding domain-containing protein [Nocardia coffeae]MBY8858999.1 NAD(P)-binding domain-containing protein [Nocardia coffeae]